MDRRDATMRLLVAAVLVECAIAVLVRGSAVRQLIADRPTWPGVAAAVGLVWLAVVLAAVRRVWRRDTALQDRLRHGAAQLAAVAVTSHDWLWEATPDMVATYSSPAVGELLGYRPEDVVGHSLLQFVHPDDLPAARAVVEDAVRGGTGWHDVELRWRHRDGRTVRLQGSAVPVLGPAGEPTGFRGTRRRCPTSGARRRGPIDSRYRVEQLLARKDLQVALQPIIGVGTGRWAEVETLARFPDGRGPETWFAEAHQAGLGLELELLAVEQALAVVPFLPDGIDVSVNASPALVLDPRLPGVLTSSGSPLHRITLEITEHAAVREYDGINAALRPLRAQGLRLAVDDTGAGYASFNHVLKLRPDVIKLDRSLLADIGTDRARRAFVTAIVLLALELGASVTAEGVETPDELDTVASLGVDHAQGYYLARPDYSPATWKTWRSRTWLPDRVDDRDDATRSLR